MELKSFRVTDFRSIQDTGWIEASRVTALIGTNESGKSNILLALWKLKPAREGDIDLLADIPRARFHTLRDATTKPVFIRARFVLSTDRVKFIANLTGGPEDELSIVELSRRLDGSTFVSFPNRTGKTRIQTTSARKILATTESKISGLGVAGKTEEPTKEKILKSIRKAIESYDTSDRKLQMIDGIFCEINQLKRLKSSTLFPVFDDFISKLIANTVFELIPPFIY